MNQSLVPRKMFECYGPYEECIRIWRYRYLDHEIICVCKYHTQNKEINSSNSSILASGYLLGSPLVAIKGEDVKTSTQKKVSPPKRT
ncbi:MAG TPA: hypothetical protein VK250_12595 [Nitrososphaeraceae archaeon]|nr:hypothetical protein [Nitrososphaeraceae archaeon]